MFINTLDLRTSIFRIIYRCHVHSWSLSDERGAATTWNSLYATPHVAFGGTVAPFISFIGPSNNGSALRRDRRRVAMRILIVLIVVKQK